jgi:hypothetical protein
VCKGLVGAIGRRARAAPSNLNGGAAEDGASFAGSGLTRLPSYGRVAQSSDSICRLEETRGDREEKDRWRGVEGGEAGVPWACEERMSCAWTATRRMHRQLGVCYARSDA